MKRLGCWIVLAGLAIASATLIVSNTTKNSNDPHLFMVMLFAIAAILVGIFCALLDD